MVMGVRREVVIYSWVGFSISAVVKRIIRFDNANF